MLLALAELIYYVALAPPSPLKREEGKAEGDFDATDERDSAACRRACGMHVCRNMSALLDMSCIAA